MTDNEIVKALECCKKPVPDCDCCPIERGDMCFDFLKEVVLDLINRQKAEIEKLQTTLFKKEDLMQMLFEQKQAYYDELVSAKAKIERLDKLTIEQRREIDRLSDYVQYTRAEAIKEFAERLTARIDCEYGNMFYRDKCFEEIERLVKEITEETKHD